MGVRTSYMMDDEDLERAANQIKELVIGDLVKQGLIDDEQARTYVNSRVVLLARKMRFGHSIMKLLGLDEEDAPARYLVAEIDP